ncbi:hypothetical protein GCM10011403_11340 [Pseudohongiella nitratireducens]|uniref:DUF4231 domain-containing protein n=1 Tax=Pseudohongiella nitratireducens TaxID=1768907 RepID=A0A917LTI1_9GAMM|nr:DUF4231 domain-containing protein [Pseudohongiella nitratireducens]GGG55948.1 hypothetical protein GCM10011403_11340 [Pseudohongiella nitratireducens]
MCEVKVTSEDLPGLYQSANSCSIRAQKVYFNSLKWYLLLLIVAAILPFLAESDALGALASAVLFLVTLGILIFLRVKRPDDIWYNGRAVAESVKTISWRLMMRADPYHDADTLDNVSKNFIHDLRQILSHNESLSHSLEARSGIKEPISDPMRACRELPVQDRLAVYKKYRIQDQASFYSEKAEFNKRRAAQWFWSSVILHSFAILMLLYRIKDPSFVFPVEVVATAAGAALTWLQAKKHNELSSAYSLTAHEIVLIDGEILSVNDEQELSDFVVSSEAAFSREHTQWAARRID